jgi:hypothetical protein
MVEFHTETQISDSSIIKDIQNNQDTIRQL